MKIFFNGDSHTNGAELIDPLNETYSYRLAKLLNADIVGNPAKSGVSNDRILRTTEDFIRECETYPDLIVIGWSEPLRFDWFYNEQYRTSRSLEDGFSIEEAKQHDPIRYEYLVDVLRNDLGYAHHVYQQNQMYNLHEKLNYLKIPHLFFNAHMSFDYCLKRTQLFLPYLRHHQFNWDNSFWNPYHETDGCFLTWGKNRNYKATEHDHLESNAHLEFSQVLFNHINSHIIKSCSTNN